MFNAYRLFVRARSIPFATVNNSITKVFAKENSAWNYPRNLRFNRCFHIFYTSCDIQTLISRIPFFSLTIVTLIVEAISRHGSLSLSLSFSINFHEHSSGHFDLSRPFTERHHSLLLPTRPHACQPSHRHAYRSLFRHTLATQRQHDDDDDVALQDLDKRYYPLNHATLRLSRFLFKRQQLFFFQ